MTGPENDNELLMVPMELWLAKQAANGLHALAEKETDSDLAESYRMAAEQLRHTGLDREPVYRHEFRVVVYNNEEVYTPEDLSNIAFAIEDENGDAIGDYKHVGSSLVPPGEVVVRLLEIANDGSYFDSGYEDEDEDMDNTRFPSGTLP